MAALRHEGEQAGLNPNRWFNNVERVAAQRIGRETVLYVANIYKYYVSYWMLAAICARASKSRASHLEREA